MNVSMELVWILLSMLQLITHMKNLSIPTPSPVLVLLMAIEKISNFKPHEIPEVKLFLRQRLKSVLKVVDYLGIILVFIIVTLVSIILITVMMFVFRKSKKAQEILG